jgi:Tfp pilus assembly protein PilF
VIEVACFSYLVRGEMVRKNMKYKSFIILIVGLLLLPGQGCKQQKGTDAERAEEMISAKTLGLAYLEENKLEEAEAEFLKIIDLDENEVMAYANLGIVYLRMGSFEQAEEWLFKAIKMRPEDPDVRLILAKVYEMSGDAEKAVDELERIMDFSPGHVKSLYNLTELYASIQGEEAEAKRKLYTSELAGKIPGNIVPQLNLIEILVTAGETDPALAGLEELQQVFPEFPKEAVEYYDQSLAALRKGDQEEASVAFMIFHNYMKVTTPYQAGMMDLKGPGGALVGSPLITFAQTQMGFQASDWEEVLAAIKYTDITVTAGLEFLLQGSKAASGDEAGNTHLTACDYNGDGDIDLYAGQFDPESGEYKHYLFKNEWGVYQDVSLESGISHQGSESAARFADYDNDGFLDLYVVKEGSNVLYRSTGEEKFDEVGDRANVGDPDMGSGALFFDYDHDGDLDLFLAGKGRNPVYRNNSDGSFVEQGDRSGLAGEDVETVDAAFGDFDEDGDIDLVVINSNGSNRLYSNQRQGLFRDVSSEVGLTQREGSSAVSVGDYNNDGFPDLFIASLIPGNSAMLLNRGDGTFEEDPTSEDLIKSLEDMKVHDAEFIDFDNDGFLDFLVVGESMREGQSGAILYHADGTGKLWLSPGILPDDLQSGHHITIFDYNDDGDLDLGICGIEGGIRLLRNDGGNNHHFIKMKLVGLRAGSAKNNYYGIGAKVEVRSGSLYQSKVVTGPSIHFGLGSRQQAEVIRILWTNGVPQNMFFPATNQDLIEEQQLKGSCPFLYAWNGEEYSFVKDIMWKSALGMPLGIMGETSAYAPSDASVDYIKIPGELMKMQGEQYIVQITGELWETIYTDKIGLHVLDHPGDVEVYVDERMGPPSDGYKLFQVSEKMVPASVTDQHGTNLLSAVSEMDDQYTPVFKQGKYQGLTEPSEITIDPGTIDPSESLYLFLYGWIFPTDASINSSISQSEQIKMSAPVIEAVNKQGEWEVIIDNLGFPMGKDKMIVADLSGKVNPNDPRIRIRTNMQVHWDQIFFAQGDPGAEVLPFELDPIAADLHYRGFSRTFRKGGRYGPHWFDYSEVSTQAKWRDLTGSYTRYGDVLPLLLEPDDKYVIKNAGDETTITFDASSLPELPEGWKRDFLILSVGWVKDGDLNTANGQEVGPLPYHGMSSYPYGEEESYPSDPDHQRYLQEYNTREVDTRDYTRALIGEEE